MFHASVKSLVMLAIGTAIMTSASQTAQAQFGRPNPVIGDSGQQITGLKYDPFTGRWVVRTDHRQIRESYLDRDRNYVDPGSYQRVNEYETDRNGVRWHITGYRWTSYGTPHGNLNRRRITSVGPGIDIDQNENIVYSPGVDHDQNQSIGYSVGANKSFTRTPSSIRTQTTPQRSNPQSIFQNRGGNSSTLRIGGSSNLNSSPFNTPNRSGGMRIRSGR